MTRGEIIFIDETGRHYQTLEFNGDMYQEGHGGTIIEKYEDGGIQSYGDYERFSIGFGRRYFGYADSADELISSFTLEGDCVDYRNNWTDYLYVINGSGRMIRALTEDGTAEIPDAHMGVFRFQNLCQLVRIKKRTATVFPKKKFVEIIARLQEIHDLKDNIDKLIHGKRDVIDTDFLNGSGMMICHERSVIELLEFIMNDQAGNMEYFIYELDYGRSYKAGMVTDTCGNDIDCSSAETVYDSLMKEAANKN